MTTSDHRPMAPLTRRAVLGGLGAGTLGLGLAPARAGAAPAHARQAAQAAFGAEVNATSRQPGLRYLTYAGYDFRPLNSTDGWTADGGNFRFTFAGNTYAQLTPKLPVGSVLREIEVYGSTTPQGAAAIGVWVKDLADGSLDGVVFGAVPGGATLSTTTLAADVEITDTRSLVVLAYITDPVPSATELVGARIGYVAPSPFVALTPAPRPYNTRDTAGLTKLAPGEERTVALPVPAGIRTAVLQLTVTETGPAGFVAVNPGGTAWPGNSSINWSAPDSNVGNTVITALGPDGTVVLRGGGSPTHVIIDVPGYLT